MNNRDTGAADGVGLNLPPPVVDPDDPLLIAQTLTYVTDGGSVLLSFTSAPFSFGAPSCGRCAMVSSLVALAVRRPADIPSLFLSLPAPSSAFKLRFFLFKALFIAILLYVFPVGAHGTIVSIPIGNLFTVAWFW